MKRIKCTDCKTKFDPLRLVRKYQQNKIDGQTYRLSYCPFCDEEFHREKVY